MIIEKTMKANYRTHTIHINGEELSFVQMHTYLGVKINCILNNAADIDRC